MGTAAIDCTGHSHSAPSDKLQCRGERTGPGGQLRVRVQRTPHHDGRPDRETAEIYAIGARIEGHKMDAREVQCDLRATIKCNK